MTGDIEIKGAAELQRALKELPVKLERVVLRGALRAGAVEIQREAKALAPVESGRLRDSIRISGGAKRGGYVYSQVKVGGNKKGDAFYAHMVEFGTKPHEIKPKSAPSLFLAGLLRSTVKHPGARAKPFMRPAFDNKVEDATKAVGKYIAERLAKLAGGKL